MIHYIDKAAVVAEINRVVKSYDPNEITSGRYALVRLRNFINTLEVKEVDLEKEVDTLLEEENYEYQYIDHYKFAKHFFELGMAVSNKAQKGE